MNFVWTDESIARLKDLVAAGESYAAIAKDLGAPSRSAIAGKVLRLGIGDTRPKNEATPAPITAVNPRARTPHQVEAKILTARAEAIAQHPAPPVLFKAPIEEVGATLGFFDLRPGRCRFSLWPDYARPTLEEMRFCGERVEPGKSWCPACAGKVFQAAPQTRRMVAA